MIDQELLRKYLRGELSAMEREELEKRLDEDPELLKLLGRMSGPTEGEQLVMAKLGGEITEEVGDLIEDLKQLPLNGGVGSGVADWRVVLDDLREDDEVIGRLGDFEILEHLATGGMAHVFRARDPRLGREVALKVLSPLLASDVAIRKRFLREARAAAKLEHENVLPIYQVVDGKVPFFAMRFLGGGSLQDALDGGREFEFEELKLIGEKVLRALRAAHRVGIIHRDIKPANLLLGDGLESLMVCDFGIAMVVEEPSLTNPGSVIGTPHYMSPEQASGYLLDGRSDLFSLGSVLFHCATGDPPFRGGSSVAVIQKVLSEESPRLRAMREEVPSWFEEFLGRMLEKNPERRIGSAELALRCLEEKQVPKIEGQQIGRSNHRVGLFFGFFGLCLVAGFLWWFWERGGEREIVVENEQVVEREQIFRVEGMGWFESLREALKAIEERGEKELSVIRVGKNVHLRIEKTLKIGSEVKVRIEGERGAVLTLEHLGSDGALIESKGDLELRNVKIVRPLSLGKGPPVIVQYGKRLLIDRCEIEVAGPRKWFPEGKLIEIRKGGEVLIERSRIVCPKGFLVTFSESAGSSRLEVTGSFLGGLFPLAFALEQGEGERLDVLLEGNFFLGMALVVDHMNYRFPSLEMKSEGNVMALMRGHTWAFRDGRVRMENLSWKSNDDVFLFEPTLLRETPLRRDHPGHEAMEGLERVEIQGMVVKNIFEEESMIVELGGDPAAYDRRQVSRFFDKFSEIGPGLGFEVEEMGVEKN